MDVPTRGNILGHFLSARYILAVLGAAGMAISEMLKTNLVVTMVGMLNHTAIGALEIIDDEIHNSSLTPLNDDNCPGSITVTNATEADGTFIWSSEVQGIILSCYFWGYALAQIPSGRLAEVYSAKWMMFFSVGLNTLCTLLTPVMAQTHYIALVVVRVAEGMSGGVTFPAMNVMLAKWAPPAERCFMMAMVFSGTSIGNVISPLTSGLLTVHFGWQTVFYLMGGVSFIWCVLWWFLVQDSPQEQPLISSDERKMIVTSLGDNISCCRGNKKLPIPWRAVLTSPPVIAILITMCCSNWGTSMVLSELPFYIKHIVKLNMTQNSLSLSLSFLLFWLFSLILSRTLDWLRVKSIITTTTARKIATGIATLGPAICLLALSYIGCNQGAAVTLMVLTVMTHGGIFCGFACNHVDIAPNFAGTLMALTNTVSTVSGILVPVFVSYMTKGNQTITAWRMVFFVTIGMFSIACTVYTIFGSGEEQPWNRGQHQDEERQEHKPLKEKPCDN